MTTPTSLTNQELIDLLGKDVLEELQGAGGDEPRSEIDFDIYSPYGVDATQFSADETLWDNFIQQISAAPETIKNLLFDPETTTFFSDLAGEKDFSYEQSAELSRIVRDVLLGQIFIGDMPSEIAQRLFVGSEEATAIANEIVSEFFAPAMGDIKALQQQNFSKRLTTTGQQNPSTMPSANKHNIINLRDNQQS